MPEVTSPLNSTAEYVLFQLFSNYIDAKMSAPNEDPQECTMDLSLISLVYGAKYVQYY